MVFYYIMKLFITDETNITKDEKFDFFVYGGLILNIQDAKGLALKLSEIKNKYNVEPQRPIKWTNEKWRNNGILEPQKHKQIKDEILSIVSTSDCKILIYLAPNYFHHTKSFAGFELYHHFDSQKYVQSQKYALNVCCFKFDKLLKEQDLWGIVLTDKFAQNTEKDLVEFCYSLYPHGGDYLYERIALPIMHLDNEYSSLHQFNDVVLGAIAYSMKEMTHNFLPKLKNNFLCDASGKINGSGIHIYPKHPTTHGIKMKLEVIYKKFERLLADGV